MQQNLEANGTASVSDEPKCVECGELADTDCHYCVEFGKPCTCEKLCQPCMANRLEPRGW